MGMSASQARMLSLTSRLSDLELRAQEISNAKIRLSDQAEKASQAYSDALDKQTLKIYSGLQSDGTSGYVDATLKNLTSYGSASTADKFRYVKTTSGAMVVDADVASMYAANSGDKATFITACGSKYGVTVTDQTSTGYKYYADLFDQISANGYVTPDGKSSSKTAAANTAVTSTTNENNSTWLQSQIDAGNVYLYEYDSTGGTTGTGAFVNVSWTSGDSALSEVTDKTDTAKAEADYETNMSSINSKDKRFDVQLQDINTEHTAVQTEIDSVKKVIQKNIERGFKIFDA